MLRRGLRAKGGFLVWRLRPSGGCIIKTGSKRYCTKEGCSSNAFTYSTNIKPGKEVHFTSGLSSCVHLRGYMTWLRGWCFFLQLVWPASSHHSSYSRVRDKKLTVSFVGRLLRLNWPVGVTFTTASGLKALSLDLVTSFFFHINTDECNKEANFNYSHLWCLESVLKLLQTSESRFLQLSAEVTHETKCG